MMVKQPLSVQSNIFTAEVRRGFTCYCVVGVATKIYFLYAPLRVKLLKFGRKVPLHLKSIQDQLRKLKNRLRAAAYGKS